jgi:hypothetical protein
MLRLLLVALTLTACASAPPSVPRAATRTFDFHSSAWLNCHLSLYRDAIRKKRGRGEPDTAAFNADERAAWDAAVATYIDTVVDKDLLFDDDMVTVGLELVRLESATDLATGFAGPPALARTLEAAMPAYRARRWPADDAQNRAYVAEMAPRLEELARAVVPDLARVYGSPWPSGPVRVDLADYAGRVGAYTTLDPVHVIITSAGPHHIEIPFHETSHALVRPIMIALERELTAAGKSSRDLWHALLFYTTGEIVRRHLPGHVPYAEANGLWTHGDWPAYKIALDKAWKPYVDGAVERDAALRALVGALP